MPDMKAPVSAGGYPQLERGHSISPTRKEPVHIPNQKGAMQKPWIKAPYQKWSKKMPGTLTLPYFPKVFSFFFVTHSRSS